MKTFKMGIVYWGSSEPFEVWNVDARSFNDACSRLYAMRPWNNMQTVTVAK